MDLLAGFLFWVELRLFGSSRLQCALGSSGHVTGFKNSLNLEVAGTKLTERMAGDLTSFHSWITDWIYKFADILTTRQLEENVYCVFSGFQNCDLQWLRNRFLKFSRSKICALARMRKQETTSQTRERFHSWFVREICSVVERTSHLFDCKQGKFISPAEVRNSEKRDNLETSERTKPIKGILFMLLLEERLARCMLGSQSYPPAALSA